jgi:hypothetical protein
VGLGPVWTVAENLSPTGIRSPDRPTRSESLYRLSCRGPNLVSITNLIAANSTGILNMTSRGAQNGRLSPVLYPSVYLKTKN